MDPRPESGRAKYSDGLLDRGVDGVIRHRYRRLGDLAVMRGHISAAQLEQLFGELGIAGILRESPPMDQLLLERKWVPPETVAELKEELDGRDFARVSTSAPTGPPPEVLYVLADPDRNFYHYALVTELSSSDHGKVWKAWDCNTHRWVQLKVLASTVSPAVRMEFIREADVLRSITSRNLATVLESGEFKGRPYLATELVDGRPLDLNDRLQATIAILANAADALHLAHQKGAVHRRLHPGCLLGSGPVVVDFGAPHLLSVDKGDRGRLDSARFVAPEIASGRLDAVSPATDVYGLGLMLWEAIERRPAFQGDSLASIYQKVVARDPAAPAAPKALRAVCMKAIARDPAKRYRSAGDFAAELRKAGGETEVTRVRRVPRKFPWKSLVAVLVLLAGGAAGGWWYLQWERAEKDRQAKIRRVLDAADAARKAVHPLKSGTPSPDQVRAAKASLEDLARVARECGLSDDSNVLTAAGTGWYWVGDRDRAAAILSGGSVSGPEPSWLRTVLAVEDAALARAAAGTIEDFEADPLVWQSLIAAVQAARSVPSDGAALSPGTPVFLRALAAVEGAREEAARLAEGEGAGPESLLLAAVLKPGPQAASCDAVLQRRPGYAPAMVLKAHFQAVEGDLPAAEASARGAVAAASRMTEAHLVHASILRAQGRSAEALEEFGTAIRATGAPFLGLVARGDFHRAAGRWEAALQDYGEALKLKPRRADLLWRVGLAWRGKGDPTKALEFLDQAVAAGPDFLPALLSRGTLRHEQGEFDKALGDLDRVVAKAPDLAVARLERGRVRRRMRQDKPALEDFEAARRLDPKLAEVHYEMANLRESLGESAAAIQLYDEALRLKPGWPEAHASRGITHFTQERFEPALADFEAALRFAPADWSRRGAVEGFRDRAIKKLEK